MNAVFLAAVGLIILAVWALIDSLEDLSETADVIFTVVAAVLALIAAFLSLPKPRRP